MILIVLNSDSSFFQIDNTFTDTDLGAQSVSNFSFDAVANKLSFDFELVINNDAEASGRLFVTLTLNGSVDVVLPQLIESTFTVDNLNYELISPNSVKLLGGTPTSTDVVIPQTVSNGSKDFTVVEIGAEAFENAGLTSVILPGTLTGIGREAFRNNQLESLVIPDGVTAIGDLAFINNQLTSLTIPSSLTSISSESFSNNQLTSITIPNGVTNIAFRAFRGNLLDRVVIPASVTSIGDFAFNVNPLTVFILEGNSPASVEVNTFGTRRSEIDLTVPVGTEAAYEAAGWTGFKSITGVE